MDCAGAPVPGNSSEDLPELFGVAWPVRPQQQVHRLGRAGQRAVGVQPGQEDRHELMQVLDVVAERGKLHGAGEELQQPGQVAGGRPLAERDRNPQNVLPARGQRLLQRNPRVVSRIK